MILTEHFVFVHVPKTGGTFVRKVLDTYAPASWKVRGLDHHATVFEIPKTHEHLPRMAFVRNPFSWYVSWFHYQQRNRAPFFMEISDGGKLPFGEAMRRAMNSNEALRHGVGPFTQQLYHLLGPSPLGVLTGKMESMREDFERFLRQLTDVPDTMADAIRATPKQNVSKHGHYRDYYDDQLRDMILERDEVVFRTFGYGWLQPER